MRSDRFVFGAQSNVPAALSILASVFSTLTHFFSNRPKNSSVKMKDRQIQHEKCGNEGTLSFIAPTKSNTVVPSSAANAATNLLDAKRILIIFK